MCVPTGALWWPLVILFRRGQAFTIANETIAARLKECVKRSVAGPADGRGTSIAIGLAMSMCFMVSRAIVTGYIFFLKLPRMNSWGANVFRRFNSPNAHVVLMWASVRQNQMERHKQIGEELQSRFMVISASKDNPVLYLKVMNVLFSAMKKVSTGMRSSVWRIRCE